jgi:hypothetical protein
MYFMIKCDYRYGLQTNFMKLPKILSTLLNNDLRFIQATSRRIDVRSLRMENDRQLIDHVRVSERNGQSECTTGSRSTVGFRSRAELANKFEGSDRILVRIFPAALSPFCTQIVFTPRLSTEILILKPKIICQFWPQIYHLYLIRFCHPPIT